MPDTDEAAWNDMQEESLHELPRFKGEEPPGVAALTGAVAKGHTTLFEGQQPLVAV